MFRRITPEGEEFTFRFEERELVARAGESVAAALLAAGVTATRVSAVGGVARGPFCLMGVCFDCLAEVDGVGSVQTCMTEARPGMVVRRQVGVRAVDEEAA